MKKKKANDLPSYMKVEFNHKVDNNPEYTQLVRRSKHAWDRHPGSKTLKQLRSRYKSC
jgi:hypothetical protein